MSIKWLVPFFCIFLAVDCDKRGSLGLDFDTFDQSSGAGWRQLAENGRFLEAANLIDSYIKKHKNLNESQMTILYFHAGQMYAFADDYKTALDRLNRSTYAEEPPDLPLRWNAYVQATIAFLSKDLKRLKECREEIAEGPASQGEKPNLDVVDRLIEHFHEPYSKAYGARRSQSPQLKPQAGQPEVELNHVYVTLQKDTIDAMAKSAFISEQFSMFEQDTIKTVSESWTGTYLMGWRAYLEIFAPGGYEGLTEGSSGIGFSASKLGSGGAAKAKLDSLTGEKTLSDLSKWLEGNDRIPWFDNIRLQSLDKGAFNAWLMDFRTDYLKYRKIKLTKGGLFDRHSYNAYRYGTPDKKKAFESKLFDDLLEVHLELSAAEGASFNRFVKALGYSASEDRGKRSFRAGTFTFFVSTLPNPAYRIRKVVCTLRETVEPRSEYKFGPDARLTVEGRTAVWMFGKD